MKSALVILLLSLVGATPATALDRAAAPTLIVTTQVSALSHPWDVQPLGEGLLITERVTKRLIYYRAGVKHVVAFPNGTVWASGETGLMSLEIDPGFQTNRRFYTCHGATTSTGSHDVRVVAWQMNAGFTAASRIHDLVTGIQITTGRHGGCRLLIGQGGALYVGTGDSTIGTNPQNLNSFNGKVLRLDRMTGAPWPTNPWPHATNLNRRYVLTYGHRNVQGLAQRADGTMWSVEHGPDRDDEVNRLVVGGNYGWNPVPGYNETVPMTDHGLPGVQQSARWSSGSSTWATSGAAWVRGSQWGSLNGTLAVASLKASKLNFFRFDSAGQLLSVSSAYVQGFGRLRSVSVAFNGDLLVTTANGTGDRVLRVHPN